MKPLFFLFLFISLLHTQTINYSIDAGVIEFQVVHLSNDNTVIITEMADATLGLHLYNRIGNSINSNSIGFPLGTYTKNGAPANHLRACALKGGGFVLEWGIGVSTTSTTLYYAIFDDNLGVLASPVNYKSSTPQYNPENSVIATTDGNFNILYFYFTTSSMQQAFLMKVDKNGTIIQGETKYTTSLAFNTISALPLKDGNIFIEGFAHSYGGAFLISSSSGTVVKNLTALYPSIGETGEAYYDNICLMNSGNVLVVSCYKSGSDSYYYGYYGIFDSTGSTIVDRTQITLYPSSVAYPVSCECLANGNCVLIWPYQNEAKFDITMSLINDTGGRPFSERVALSGMGVNEISHSASYSDSSFLIASLTTSNGYITFSYFNSDLHKIYFPSNCPLPNWISSDKTGCYFIGNCSSYNNNGTCLSCATSTVLSVNKLACFPIIANCTLYNDNGTCQTCDNTSNLTVNSLTCAKTITDCSIYSDDHKCLGCSNNKSLTVGRWNCTQTIANCNSYDDLTGLCQNCNNFFNITEKALACAPTIPYCQNYYDINMTCHTCIANFSLSKGGAACWPTLAHCMAYSDQNFSCLECQTNYVITEGRLGCAMPVDNCVSYSDNTSCHECKANYFPIINMSAFISSNHSSDYYFNISNGGVVCAPIITNCLIYFELNLTCKTCIENYSVSQGRTACWHTIDNCQSYYDENMTCSMCQENYFKTGGSQGCAQSIENCSKYFDNNTCEMCNPPYLITEGNFGCATPLDSCLTYYDDRSCHECQPNYVMTEGRLGCAKPIDHCVTYFDNKSCHECDVNYLSNIRDGLCYSIKDCVVYSADNICTQCQDPLVLSFGNINCVSAIPGCANHSSENITCLNCSSSKQLSNTSFSCLTPIPYCLSISDQALCLNCSNGKIQSYSWQACVDKIVNCQVQTDDICSSCFSGLSLSTDKRSCINISNNTANNVSNFTNTIKSKIKTKLSNDSTNQSMGYLSKDKDTPIVIENTYDTSYQMFLDKTYIVFSNNEKNFSVDAGLIAGNQSNTIYILANLSSIPSASYTMLADLSFLKLIRRILQNGTENYFVISYQSEITFFIGTDAEIANAKKVNQNNGNETSSNEDISKETIFEIVFPILGFFILVGLFCCVRRKLKKRRDAMEKFRIGSPDFDRYPLKG